MEKFIPYQTKITVIMRLVRDRDNLVRFLINGAELKYGSITFEKRY